MFIPMMVISLVNMQNGLKRYIKKPARNTTVQTLIFFRLKKFIMAISQRTKKGRSRIQKEAQQQMKIHTAS